MEKTRQTQPFTRVRVVVNQIRSTRKNTDRYRRATSRTPSRRQFNASVSLRSTTGPRGLHKKVKCVFGILRTKSDAAPRSWPFRSTANLTVCVPSYATTSPHSYNCLKCGCGDPATHAFKRSRSPSPNATSFGAVFIARPDGMSTSPAGPKCYHEQHANHANEDNHRGE